MNAIVSVATAWTALLFVALLAAGLRRPDPLDRLLAVETATATLVAVLGLQAFEEHEAAYLEVAFAIALLSYGETLLVSRWVRRRRPFP